jgi:hypothetical protein
MTEGMNKRVSWRLLGFVCLFTRRQRCQNEKNHWAHISTVYPSNWSVFWVSVMFRVFFWRGRIRRSTVQRRRPMPAPHACGGHLTKLVLLCCDASEMLAGLPLPVLVTSLLLGVLVGTSATVQHTVTVQSAEGTRFALHLRRMKPIWAERYRSFTLDADTHSLLETASALDGCDMYQGGVAGLEGTQAVLTFCPVCA